MPTSIRLDCEEHHKKQRKKKIWTIRMEHGSRKGGTKSRANPLKETKKIGLELEVLQKREQPTIQKFSQGPPCVEKPQFSINSTEWSRVLFPPEVFPSRNWVLLARLTKKS